MARNRNLIPFSPLSYFPHSSPFSFLDTYNNRALRSTCFASDHENHDFENEKRARLKWGAKRNSWGINSRRAEEETRLRSLLPKWDPVQFLHGEDVYLGPEPRVFFYFEIPSIHHASETRLAPPPPPPRSALPPPANLSFAFFHLSRSSCHLLPSSSSSSPPPVMRYTTDFRASLIFLPTPPRLTEADLW